MRFPAMGRRGTVVNVVMAVAVVGVACSSGGGDREGAPSPTGGPSTTSTAALAPGDAVTGGRLLPSPVLFGAVVLRPDRSGGLADVTPEKSPAEVVHDAFFLDDRVGWVGLTDAATPRGRLLGTDDGGRTWRDLALPVRRHDGAGSLVRMFLLDAAHGWILDYDEAGGGALHRTRDGGRTWTQLPRTPLAGTFRFVTPTHGWLSGWVGPGSSRGFFETVDGGETWRRRTLDAPPGAPHDRLSYRPAVFSDGTGVVAASVGNDERERLAFYVSRDGGGSWVLSATIEEGGFGEGSTAVASATTWWAVSVDGSKVRRTTDAGATWQRVFGDGINGFVRELEAVNEREAWATTVDNGRVVVRATDDGGATWRALPDRAVDQEP